MMASFIGVNIPANSIGQLPLIYLKASPKYRFLSAYATYREILEQYVVMKAIKKAQIWRFMFNDFPNFTEAMQGAVTTEITKLASKGKWCFEE